LGNRYVRCHCIGALANCKGRYEKKKLVVSSLLIAGLVISGCGNDAKKAKQAITDSLDRASDEAWCDALSDAGNWDLYAAEDC
jgi:outer membrane murein-binding lipoprotein Lpp